MDKIKLITFRDELRSLGLKFVMLKSANDCMSFLSKKTKDQGNDSERER